MLLESRARKRCSLCTFFEQGRPREPCNPSQWFPKPRLILRPRSREIANKLNFS